MVLSVRNLSIAFPAPQGGEREVVSDLSFTLDKGEMLAVVGESGSGKSLTALALLGLLPRSAKFAGEITFENERLNTGNERQMRRLRGSRIAMIFQEPMTALNPLHTVERQIGEVLEIHQPQRDARQRQQKILTLLDEVGLSGFEARLQSYPHQLSGGERQRVMIAMAIACDPQILLADEPTTALDVALQKQVLELLQRLQKERGLAIMLITHDLPLVRRVAQRVMVLKQGKCVETQPVEALFVRPKSDYTRQLISASPQDSALLPQRSSGQVLLEVSDMTIRFPVKKNLWGRVIAWKTAVDMASFTLNQGYSLGIVGESGSGKTTLALAILKLIATQNGTVIFLGNNISSFNNRQMQSVRSQMQLVLQDPFGSLNPRMTVCEIIGEGLRVHQPQLTMAQRRRKVAETLEQMQLQPEMLDRYPHEFSGGQRQRIAIARAMVLAPSLIVMDEPTSALDVTVQAQVIDLLRELQQRSGVSFLFISHDLRVVRALCHQILVLRQGKIIEQAEAEQFFAAPQHEYSCELLQAALGRAQ